MTREGFAPTAQQTSELEALRKEASTVLQELLADSSAPFFKAESLKNLSALPVAPKVSKLAQRFAQIARQGDARLLQSAVEEVTAIELLDAWSNFRDQLANSTVETAGKTLRAAIGKSPKQTESPYAPLWTAAAKWDQIFQKASAEFQAHVDKGRRQAALGKHSDAIREYQAAYGIVENATIATEIQKLRKESLGL